ncbi:unnamed protein product [Rhizoctonia solani]|uniref:Uncharacterized protein n=1 Tax=Rhizoctonia solani TaxID=456999 RepID=A0A8H3EDQ7_9AGAM|nr:unnamed protein product [Rhizoctonia solani]
MWGFQIDSYPDNRTVTIILDYCRPNKDIPFGTQSLSSLPTRTSHLPPVGVEFIWSCSPGQMAAALILPSARDIPRSCFLLALMMTAYSARIKYRVDLIATINHELCRLLRLLQLAHKKIHEDDRCDRCKGKQTCLTPIQEPYWKWAGSLESVSHLVYALSKMEVVSKVYAAFTTNKFFREANDLQPKIIASELSSSASHLNDRVERIRGSTKPVHAGMTIQTELQHPGHEGALPPLRNTLTRYIQEPKMEFADLSQVPQESSTESPPDTHPYCCTHIPGYSFKWCTCFTHDL